MSEKSHNFKCKRITSAARNCGAQLCSTALLAHTSLNTQTALQKKSVDRDIDTCSIRS